MVPCLLEELLAIKQKEREQLQMDQKRLTQGIYEIIDEISTWRARFVMTKVAQRKLINQMHAVRHAIDRYNIFGSFQ